MHSRVILYMVTYMTCNYGISKIHLYLLVCSDDISRHQYYMLKCNVRPLRLSHHIIALQKSNWTADVEMSLWAMFLECIDYL
jgi:hypothetical protein